ncbi:xanthine dehydrogenase family protein molybdopterin-binding subunit [Henriciella sp. AS95]|uniref:xanthine dehydrogenase family protein molybdopterin-binding subunit n=1 Tax=Henriciella sp. AS95 TaxID=3135782 RepID=UPI003176F4F9
MTNKFEMNQPVVELKLDRMKQGLVGSSMDRPEGKLKVSGTATYAHEWKLDNCAFGFLVRSRQPRAKVTAIGRDAVMDMPGVLGVYDDERLIRNPAQGMADEAPVQGPDEVFYLGQPIALVVAETFEQARHAAEALEVTYSALDDAVFDPEEAEIAEDDQGRNSLEQGHIEAAMSNAAYTVDEIFRTPGHNSAAMEPHCSIAEWEGDKLTLRGSYQMLKFNRNELADSLGIEPENVRILSPYVGGGFGSKLGISPEAVSAAIAAKALGRPVCVTLSRQQVFDMVMRRSETRQRLRLACDDSGKLTAIGHEALVSNLPGEGFAEPVVQATHFLYGGENRKLGIDVARVNRMCAGSVRAPGEAVGMQVLENAMDELAEKVGIDPVEFRKRNIPERHPEKGIPYASRKLHEALDEGAKRFGWDKRTAKPRQTREGEWLIGTGMATATRVNMLMESQARVTLKADGSAVVETDMTDIGTGTYAILTQIAGDMLGLPADRVETKLGDTDMPPSSGSGGSFGASSSGSAVFLACEDIRTQIAQKLQADEEDLAFENGEVKNGDETHSLAGLLDGKAIVAEGHIVPGETGETVSQGTYGAFFAEVAVNEVTGETRVRRLHGTFDAGRILNQKTATSQCYGGLVWGIGIALTEELMFDNRDGHIANRDLAEYHLPVNLDVPDLDVVLLEERDPWASPIQAKGIGELSICGAAAAITNAMYNATGVRFRDYPATLDKVISAI